MPWLLRSKTWVHLYQPAWEDQRRCARSCTCGGDMPQGSSLLCSFCQLCISNHRRPNLQPFRKSVPHRDWRDLRLPSYMPYDCIKWLDTDRSKTTNQQNPPHVRTLWSFLSISMHLRAMNESSGAYASSLILAFFVGGSVTWHPMQGGWKKRKNKWQSSKCLWRRGNMLPRWA